jgi:hypothetical protein
MTKTKYKVMAVTGFRGHKQGDTFEADLPEDVERRAKERGSIRVLERGDTKEKKDG